MEPAQMKEQQEMEVGDSTTMPGNEKNQKGNGGEFLGSASCHVAKC